MNTNFPFNRFNFLPLIENIKKEDAVPNLITDEDTGIEFYGANTVPRDVLINLLENFNIIDNLAQANSKHEYERQAKLGIKYFQFEPSWVQITPINIIVGYVGIYVNTAFNLTFYMETTLIRYISNYLSSEVVELEELMEIKQLIQRQKLERMMKVHKEMRGLDRYREQPKEYKYHDPYDDWIFRQLADIDNRNNIPNTSPQLDFNETDYEDYLKEKWNRGL